MAWLVTGKEISFIKKSRENDEFYTHKKKKNENAEGKIFNDGLNIFRLISITLDQNFQLKIRPKIRLIIIISRDIYISTFSAKTLS